MYELPTSELPDVLDGSLRDWERVLAPSVGQQDFIAMQLGASVANFPAPEDRVGLQAYLAWHHASQRLFFGLKQSGTTDDGRVPSLVAATATTEGGGASVYEIYLTPWDELRPRPADSRATPLVAGRVIGFELRVVDSDPTVHWEAIVEGIRQGTIDFEDPFFQIRQDDCNLGGMHQEVADYFVDGVLVPCDVEDCSASPSSAVVPSTWGRIKASLGAW